jgi:hypothetical protein
MSAGEDIWQDIQSIVNKNTDTFRVRMDSNVHCMDVGIKALQASDPDIDYATKEKLHRLFRREFFVFNSLEEAILHSRDSDNIDRTCFVEDPKFGDYIVGPSYSTLQRRVATVLKSSAIGSAFTGTDTTGKTTTNIGHLSLKGSEAATTPLEAKLKQLLNALQSTPIASSLVSSKIKQLHKYHTADTSYVFNRKSFDLQGLQDILGSGTVLVTLQTSIKNAALAKVEATIEREVSAYLKSQKFHNKLLKVHGSNTIPEDLIGAIKATLIGQTTVPGSKHTQKKPNKASKSLLSAKEVSASKLSKVKNIDTGRYISLTSLQNLINRHLQDVISANMGDGNRKDVLNYRTGRFASTAKVERMSQSREGMITAFYSYMKNPYATFSDGGQQQYPKSRDPKLLISKSIREIAAEKVANRMRAVAV